MGDVKRKQRGHTLYNFLLSSQLSRRVHLACIAVRRPQQQRKKREEKTSHTHRYRRKFQNPPTLLTLRFLHFHSPKANPSFIIIIFSFIILPTKRSLILWSLPIIWGTLFSLSISNKLRSFSLCFWFRFPPVSCCFIPRFHFLGSSFFST